MRALRFPFHIDASGGIGFTDDPGRAAVDRVKLLVATSPTERPMMPSYGAGASDYLFENNDEERGVLLSSTIEDQLEAHEPNLIVDEVLVESEAYDEASGFSVGVQFHLVEQRETGGLYEAVIDVGGTVREVV